MAGEKACPPEQTYFPGAFSKEKRAKYRGLIQCTFIAEEPKNAAFGSLQLSLCSTSQTECSFVGMRILQI